jgi:hypothetical protein
MDDNDELLHFYDI